MGDSMTWLWWAPFGATVLHIIEEFVYPGGFAEWDRSYRPTIRNSITTRFHIIINGALLLLCAQVGLLAGTDDMEATHISCVIEADSAMNLSIVTKEFSTIC